MRVTTYFGIAAKWMGHMYIEAPDMNSKFKLRCFGITLAKLGLIWEEDTRGRRIKIQG